MSEKIPQSHDEEEDDEASIKKSGSFTRGTLAAGAVFAAAVGGVALNMENHEQIKEAAAHNEKIQEQLPPEFKAGLEKYHLNISWQSGTEIISAMPSNDEVKARAAEIAVENGITQFDGTITFKQTKEGVPFDIAIGTNAVPYSPDNYGPAELASLKAEAEKGVQ